MTNSKDKRLNKNIRNVLVRYAQERVEATEPCDYLDEAYDAAAKVISDHCLKEFPIKDMKVLEKYGMAVVDQCIHIGSSFSRFCFKDDDKRSPLRPYKNCRSMNIILDDDTTYIAYTRALEKYKCSARARLSDYEAIIHSSRTFNEVVSIWQDAENLREKICGRATSLVTLSEDVIERIKNDAANMDAKQ